MPNKNNGCCGDTCANPHGETRLYPLGGGANLILCHACWDHENRYRAFHGGEHAGFPIQTWSRAKIYPEPMEPTDATV